MNETSHAPGSILLVEDNPADIYLMRQVLQESGIAHAVHVVSDGQQALSFLKQTSTSAHEEKPALILLDLNLPKHDGMEILSFVRLDNRLASIPVIVLTSSDSPRDRSTATQLHATEYVRKPSSLEECVAIGSVIQRVLAHNLDGESSHETPTELLSAEALRTNS